MAHACTIAIRGRSSLMNSAPAKARKERGLFSLSSRYHGKEFPDAMVSHGHRGNVRWSIGMTKTLLIVAAIAGVSLLPSVANAQERLGDGAMGALAGALVGGPVGLVAGGVVGYTAGPSIASSWGLRGHRHYRHVHYRRYPAR
jgi:hypothetical protein